MTGKQGPQNTSLESLRRENERLKRSVKDLELLNDVAKALGAARDLKTVLRRIMRGGRDAVGAEQGTVTLIDAARSDANGTVVRTSAQSSRDEVFRTPDEILARMLWYKRPICVNDPAPDERFHTAGWDPAIRSLLCVPLLVNAALVGVLTVFNKRGGGFSDEDEQLLAILAAQSAQVIENARVREEGDRVRRIFGQHTDPAVVSELLDGEAAVVPRRQRVCVMFLDVRDFTTFAESAEPEVVLAYLNGLLWFMIEAVNRHHGIVHQLLGDGFMALFGAPVSQGNDCRNAVRAALEIVARLEGAVEAGALPPTKVGIGLHAGEVVAGLVGSHVHQEYKVTGDVVNLAARIEGLNKDLGSQLLVSEVVWKALGAERPEAEPLGAVDVRGRRLPVTLYRLA